MSAPNPADQQNPSWQRTVLLASDSSQSVIAEVADGKTNTIAYSAYGEQSAQQPITTALGFNGQLREISIGVYILGNGYRAYNPKLMRFHSPDSWSPFGRGGLNAYMYCVGDPVNRVDPTGHVPWFHPRLTRWAKNTFNFFFDPDRTGVHKTTQRQAISERLLGGLQPETTGEGKALFAAGAAMAERAPAPRGYSSPGGDMHPPATWGADTHFAGPPSRARSTGPGQSSTSSRISQARKPSIDSFYEPRTIYTGPGPKDPPREKMTLLGGAKGTSKSSLYDRTSHDMHRPVLQQYRPAQNLPQSNGWWEDTHRDGYRNFQIRLTRGDESLTPIFLTRNIRRQSR